MTAHHNGKVCKDSMQCVQTRAPTHSQALTAKGRARHKKKVSVRLRAAVTCAAYFSYFAYTIPKKYAAPEATMSHSH